MTVVYVVFAFVAGWAACWYFGKFIVKRFARSKPPFMRDTIKKLPITTLQRMRKQIDEELDIRRRALDG